MTRQEIMPAQSHPVHHTAIWQEVQQYLLLPLDAVSLLKSSFALQCKNSFNSVIPNTFTLNSVFISLIQGLQTAF